WLFTASWLLMILAGTEGTLLTDRANLVLGVRIARVAATVPTLEHFEHSGMLGRLEQLTANRRTLAGAPRQLISLFGQTLRAVGIVVLLATIYLPVLVVPLLALGPGAAHLRHHRRAGPPPRRAGRAGAAAVGARCGAQLGAGGRRLARVRRR